MCSYRVYEYTEDGVRYSKLIIDNVTRTEIEFHPGGVTVQRWPGGRSWRVNATHAEWLIQLFRRLRDVTA